MRSSRRLTTMISDWIPFSSASPWSTSKQPETKPKTKREQWLASYEAQPVEVRIASTLAAGSVATLVLVKLYTRYLRRYPSHGWITPDLYAKKRWMKGIVTSVGDPDGFRFYHTPGSITFWKLRGIPHTQKGLKDQTISIRLAGVDAPELGHFSKESQPFSKEALIWLKQMVLGKPVYCQLLARDQYSRSVAAVTLPRPLLPDFLTPKFGKNLANEMLRAGLAVTYMQSGAVYGRGGKEGHLALEAEAKYQRRGQWVNGEDIETPAEYKRRHRSPSASEESAATSEIEPQEIMDGEGAAESERRSRGRLRRFWSKLIGSGS